uniref:CSON005812 protein n=1 Tax=Culicoides sonorensis TaxID=179676 RepID=A0A336MV70_CULSO
MVVLFFCLKRNLRNVECKYFNVLFFAESRSSKLKKIALPILLALKLKSTIIIPIVLKALAFLSIKALISGTLALILSSLTFFKDFFGKKRERITTAYITAPGPVQAELVEGWNRNGLIESVSHDLAYNGQYVPQNEYQNTFPSQF